MTDLKMVVASKLSTMQRQAMNEGDFGLAVGIELAAERYSETMPVDVATEFLSAYYHGSQS